MDIPQLDITHQNAEIEVVSHKARVEISTRRPKFRIKRDMARFMINRQMPTMRIDRSSLYEALGIGPVLQEARQYCENAVQQGIDGIGQIAADGTSMLQIENGGNPLADMADEAFTPQGDLNITAMPPAQVSWEPGYISIQWTPGQLAMEWDVSAWADIRVEPHYVEIRMKKYPEVRIRVSYKPRSHKLHGKFVDKYL